MKTKDGFIHIRISKKKHQDVTKKAKSLGMTLTGFIRFAVKKVFGIEI